MDHRGTGHKKIPKEVIDAIGSGSARDFYILCERNGLSFDAFDGSARERYFLGEMEFDGELEQVDSDEKLGVRITEINRVSKYGEFLEELRNTEINVRDFAGYREDKGRLVRKYFPSKAGEWSGLRDVQFGYMFSRLVAYSEKLETKLK
jgi:hypothetical protein